MGLIQADTFPSQAAGQATMACAFGVNVTKGNLLIVCFSDGGGGTLGIPPASITDTQGNIWTRHAFQTDVGGAASVEIYNTIAGATGPCTVNFDFAGNVIFPCAIIAEFSTPHNSIDQFTTNGSTQGGVPFGSTATPAAITTTGVSLLLAGCTTGQGNGTASVDSGYSIAAQLQNPNGLDSIVLAFLENAAIGTYQPTFTWVNSFSPEACQCDFIAGVTPGTGIKQLLPPVPRRLPWDLGKPRLTEGKHLFLK